RRRARDGPRPPVSPHAAGRARHLRCRARPARGHPRRRPAAGRPHDGGASRDARRGHAGHRGARGACPDHRAARSARRCRHRESCPYAPPGRRPPRGSRSKRACRHRRRGGVAARRRRARRGGDELGDDQRPTPRPAAGGTGERDARATAISLHGGVRRDRGGDPRRAPEGRGGPPGGTTRMTLSEIVRRHRVVVSAGSGGVGKTTVAASIALWGSLEGRRTAVITIDPARRLASSLGLATLGHDAREIPAAMFAAQGLAPKAPLSAMMLDQKGAWDALVERYAPPDARQRILANPFYQHLSQTFAGSQEYMAIEQLCLLVDSGAYDLVVVDTPPTRHALDFLEAPKR